VEGSEGRLPHLRACSLEGGDEVGEEADRIVVLTVEGEPGDVDGAGCSGLLLVAPGRHERGLSVSGGCADEGQFPSEVEGLIERGVQARPRHQPGARWRYDQFGVEWKYGHGSPVETRRRSSSRIGGAWLVSSLTEWGEERSER
jgi:hypothetical protein